MSRFFFALLFLFLLYSQSLGQDFCGETLFAHHAIVYTYSGGTVNNLSRTDLLSIQSDFSKILPLNNVHYLFPAQFSYSCSGYKRQEILYASRPSGFPNFSDTLITRYTKFSNNLNVNGILIDSVILIKDDSTSSTITEVIPISQNQRWAFFSTALATDTIKSNGKLDAIQYSHYPLSYVQDSSTFFNQLAAGPWKESIPSNISRTITVQLIQIHYSETPPPTKVTLLFPNGGEYFAADSLYNLSWESTGIIGLVDLHYSIDATTWYTIATGVKNVGITSWSMPNISSNTVKVKVSYSGGVPDVSDANFSILPKDKLPALSFSSPSGGEYWQAKSQQTLSWETQGDIPVVSLYYGEEGTTNWTLIAKNIKNNGSYNWTLPEFRADNILIRLTGLNGFVSTIAQAPIEIYTTNSRSIKIISPNGGEQLKPESTQKVTWESTGNIAFIKAELFAQGKWQTLTTSSRNDGELKWTLPKVTLDSLKIRLTDTKSKTTDESDGYFSIEPERSLKFTTPTTSDTLEQGKETQIKWETSGIIRKVTLQHSTDKETWTDIAKDIANTNRLIWSVPSNIEGTITLRLLSSDGKHDHQQDITIKKRSETQVASSAVKIQVNQVSPSINGHHQFVLQGITKVTRLEIWDTDGRLYARLPVYNNICQWNHSPSRSILPHLFIVRFFSGERTQIKKWPTL